MTEAEERIAKDLMDEIGAEELGALLARTGFWGSYEARRPGETPEPRKDGSCVLIQGKWGQGALTAAHCLRAAEEGRISSIMVRQHQGGTAKGLISIEVPTELVKRNQAEFGRRLGGPDLAFVPLSKSIQERMEAMGSVFHNLEHEWKRWSGRANPFGYYFGVGHVASDAEEAAKTEGRPDDIVPRIVQMRPSGRYTPERRNGWDYWQMEVTLGERGEGTTVDLVDKVSEEMRRITLKQPESWKGMSGGGVWWIGREKDGKLDRGLGGIVFEEEERSTQAGNLLMLKAHGPASIHRFMKRVMEAKLQYNEPIARVYPQEQQGWGW